MPKATTAGITWIKMMQTKPFGDSGQHESNIKNAMADVVTLQDQLNQALRSLIEVMGVSIPETISVDKDAIKETQALVAQDEAQGEAWVKEGRLVKSAALCEAWATSRQALDRAVARDELFSLKVGRNRFYPKEFLEIEAQAVKTVCKALTGDDAASKFVFWLSPHDALNAKTIAQAIQSGGLDRVVQLATEWSQERGFSALNG
jgi:hypothetical protein